MSATTGREPAETLLYEVVEQNLPAFLAETRDKSPLEEVEAAIAEGEKP